MVGGFPGPDNVARARRHMVRLVDDAEAILPHHCHVQGDNPKARPLFVTALTWDSDGWPKVDSAE